MQQKTIIKYDNMERLAQYFFNPFLSIKKSGLDILLTGYNNLTLQTY
jgi:hypothetical protein